MNEDDLHNICTLLKEILPVDPFEFRPISTRVTLNIGKIARAVNKREIPVEKETRSPEEMRGLIATRYDQPADYPELLVADDALTAWRYLILCPALVARDQLGNEILLDGRLRVLRRLRHTNKVNLFRISLADAVCVGAEGDTASATEALEDYAKWLPDPSWRSVYANLGAHWFVPELPAAIEAKRDDKTLQYFWFEIFREYFDVLCDKSKLSLQSKSDKLEFMKAYLYDNITYFGIHIRLDSEFDTINKKHLAPSRRHVFKLNNKEKLASFVAPIFMSDQPITRAGEENIDFIASEFLRKLYILHTLINQEKRYKAFASNFRRKTMDAKRKYKSPLLNFVRESDARIRAESDRLLAGGSSPVSLADLIPIAIMTRVNPGRCFPHLVRMSAIFEVARQLPTLRQRHSGDDAEMLRAQFGLRSIIEQLGGDAVSTHWKKLFSFISADGINAIATDCVEEMALTLVAAAQADGAL